MNWLEAVAGALLGAAAALLLGGCGTFIGSRCYGDGPYKGVRYDLDFIALEARACPVAVPLYVLDLPFSAAADTVMLPFQIGRIVVED